jgi:hypothetical protein
MVPIPKKSEKAGSETDALGGPRGTISNESRLALL